MPSTADSLWQERRIVLGGAVAAAAAAVLGLALWRRRERQQAGADGPVERPALPEGMAPVENAVARAVATGLLMELRGGGLAHAPFALAPVELPAAAFQAVYGLAAPFGKLVDAVSRDETWLQTVHKDVVAGDAFTSRLLALAKEVSSGGARQPLSLGLLRSDYMLDEQSGRMLQVELNTIASSFGGLSSRVSSLHRYLAERFPSAAYGRPAGSLEGGLPTNEPTVGFAAAMARAHQLYCGQAPAAQAQVPTCVVFVVQPDEVNTTDQRILEHDLWRGHGVPVLRRSLRQLHDSAQLRPADWHAGGGDGYRLRGSGRVLVIPDGERDVEVSLVYFRAGYTPGDYFGEEEWSARSIVEHSSAVKCPDIFYHLAGTKKVQQELAAPGGVERFAGQAEAAQLRECFAGIWALDAESRKTATVAAAIREASAHPGQFVVKPQREGGGNNIYGADVARFLTSANEESMAAHILMRRIFPREHHSVMVRPGRPAAPVPCISEIGIYSAVLSDGERVEVNGATGHLVRTKSIASDEGGIAAGASVADSPLLK